MKTVAASVLILCAVAVGVYSQQADMSEEIKRLRRELMQVQEERNRTQEEIEKDKEDFQQYRKRALERMRQVRQETDSTQGVIREYTARRDSLDALVNGVRDRIRQYELLQEAFRKELIVACDTLELWAQRLPPLSSEKALSSIGLLRNELSTKSVGNVESMPRLFQIAKDMHETGSSIQISQGTSPVPEIRGTAYRLRLGSLFEGAVNLPGTHAAVWTGNDENGDPAWRPIEDIERASAILKAVNVREGKSLPALVSLPMQDVTVVRPNETESESEHE